MKVGLVPLLRQVHDARGLEHVYRCRNNLWSLQPESNRELAQSLHPHLQGILNDLGRQSLTQVSQARL